jgi:hypothetical protein
MFMLPKNLRILRSLNASVIAVSLTRDVKRGLVAETLHTEVPIVFVCPRDTSSKVVMSRQIIFL